MEVLEKPSSHFLLPHALKTEPRIWGVCEAEARIPPLETARRWYGAMLTTCPNCLHVFDQPVQPVPPSCCARRSPHDTTSSASAAAAAAAPPAAAAAGDSASAPQSSLLLSATLHLPAAPAAATTAACTLAVTTTTTAAPPRALASMAGGGIVLQQHPFPFLQDPSKATMSVGVAAPQPSPSAPLSFVLPPASAPGPASTPRALPVNSLPFQWAVPAQSGWSLAGASVHLNLQVPPPMAAPPPPPSPTSPLLPQTPQSDTDLERLAATMSSLRASGWYYEGLSWQESSDLLQDTELGTFLVRDSSDPRFLFSLSVQTERGPTSIRLHYVCGNFRLDAEPRLAPFMPLFDCVVKLVEHYVEFTRNRRERGVKRESRDKEQVWVDARGQMYSHILLRNPLYKKTQLPTLQHLARLAINKQMKTVGRSATIDAVCLPLPLPLQAFIKEYPYMS